VKLSYSGMRYHVAWYRFATVRKNGALSLKMEAVSSSARIQSFTFQKAGML